MNKSIFKKIKRSHLESINQSPSSQEEIQFMSVQDMQKTLLTHINSSKNQFSSQTVVISQNSIENNYAQQNSSINLKNNEAQQSIDVKKVPDLIQQNDKLKDQIEKLKSQRKLILSQYENISVSAKINPQILPSIPQKTRQFSFRKSVENIEKMLSANEKEKEMERSNVFRQRQLGSIHQRNVPSSDSNRNERRSSSRRSGASLEVRGIGSHSRASGSKEVFSTLEERFYQYCKNQMVRMNSENTKLTLKIGELQNKITTLHKQYELLQKQNINLQALNDALQQKLKLEGEKINQISQQMSTTLIKKQQLVQNQFKILKNQLTEFRENQQKLRKQINQKDVQITVLKAQISQKTKQQKSQVQLISKNVYLQNQVNELMLRNRKVSEKFRRMPTIDHLWEIKEVEYENLINLIQQQKLEVQNYQNLKNSKNQRISSSVLDLTFAKDRSSYR